MELLEIVNKLIKLGKGERGRLEYIKEMLENNRKLYNSDLKYVENLKSRYLHNDTPGDKVNDDETSSKVNDDETSSKVNDDETSSKVNDDETSSKVNDDETSSKVNDDETSSKVNDDETSSKVNDDETSSKVNDDETSSKVNDDETSSKVNDDETSSKVNDDETSGKVSEPASGIKKSDPRQKKSGSTRRIALVLFLILVVFLSLYHLGSWNESNEKNSRYMAEQKLAEEKAEMDRIVEEKRLEEIAKEEADKECIVWISSGENLQEIKDTLTNAESDCRVASDISLPISAAKSDRKEEFCYERTYSSKQHNQCIRDVSKGMNEIISRHYEVSDFNCSKNYERWDIGYDKCRELPRINDWLNLGVKYDWKYVKHDGLYYGPSGFYDVSKVKLEAPKPVVEIEKEPKTGGAWYVDDFKIEFAYVEKRVINDIEKCEQTSYCRNWIDDDVTRYAVYFDYTNLLKESRIVDGWKNESFRGNNLCIVNLRMTTDTGNVWGPGWLYSLDSICPLGNGARFNPQEVKTDHVAAFEIANDEVPVYVTFSAPCNAQTEGACDLYMITVENFELTSALD